MKKVLATILFFVSLSASAANWETIFYGNDKSIHYINNESIVYYNNGSRGAWIKEINVDNTSTLMFAVIHCPTRKLRLEESVYYNNVGIMTHSTGGTLWSNIIPDASGQFWYNKICKR